MSNKTRAYTAVLGVAALAAAEFAVPILEACAAVYTPMTETNIPIEPLTRSIAESDPNARQIRLGQYLLRAADCASCHTRKEGKFLAGGYGMSTPFGTIYSTNLTPDPETGIGNWTSDQFYAALHDGNGSHGPIYPAMPYPYLTHVTRADTDAIFVFLKTLSAVKERPPANDLSFPFNLRFLVNGWKLLFFRQEDFAADQSKSPEWNRGAYLVTGPGHCGACHTPKNFLAADKKDKPLQGGTLDNWVAPDLTGNARTGLGSWNTDEVVEYLKTGRNVHANAGAVMAEVVSYSTSLLTDEDLRAIATYLKDRPASPDATLEAPDAGSMKRGEAIYTDACTACHMEKALGQPRYFPPLQHDAVLQQTDPTGLLHILLAGVRTAATASRPSPLTMPAFAWKLTDQQVADVATYVRNSWGNRAKSVTADQVGSMRKNLLLDRTQGNELSKEQSNGH